MDLENYDVMFVTSQHTDMSDTRKRKEKKHEKIKKGDGICHCIVHDL